MAVIAKQRYKLDIAPKGGWVIVYASQHDDGAREIEFEITNQGNAYSIPASINISVQGVKSNKGYFSHSCSYSGNIVTMTLANDMTDVIGKAICVLKFTNSFQQKLATAKFILNVDSDSSSEGVIIDTEAEEIFNQMLNEIRAQASAISIDIAELQSMVGTPLIATTAAGMTNHNKIYVYTGSESGYTSGNWYYWNGSAWTSGGQYNSVPIVVDQTPTSGSINPVSSNGVYTALGNKVDKVSGKGLSTEDYTTAEKTKLDGLTQVVIDHTLTHSGQAADAKVVGDEISDLKEDLNNDIKPLYDIYTAPVDYTYLKAENMWTMGEGVAELTGNTLTNAPGYIRTPYNTLKGQTLVAMDSAVYKFIVWGYSAASVTSATYSPNRAYSQDPVIIAPLHGTTRFRIGVTRTDGADMTSADVTAVIAAIKTYELPGIRANLKIACFGDSIMWGRDGAGSALTRVSDTIPSIISKSFGCKCDNFGVGSQGYLPTGNVPAAYDNISSVDLTQYDAMIMCYGVNDGFHPLGDWDSTDETTIMGQFNKILNHVFSQNPIIRLIVFAPFNGTNIGTYPDYWYGPRSHPQGYVSRRILSDTLKTACDYYWVPYIEQYDSPINPFNISNALPDGVHLSADYYKLIGEWFAAKVATII